MTTISSLGALNSSAITSQSTASLLAASGSASTSSGNASGSASAQVTLTSSTNTESLTYLKPALSSTIWESTANDTITSLMASNLKGTTLASRFHGIGQALLARFTSDGGNYSQSALPAQAGQTSNALLTQTTQQVLHAAADNQITLNVTTRSGTKVAITLGSDDDGGLATQIKITNGTLTDAERKSLASLADGFQQAIDGLDGDTPSLDLGGLNQFDTTTLSSMDLHAALKAANGHTQTVDFHADARQRTVSARMDAGTVDVSVDTRQLAQLGNAQQQQQAISAYLKQFDDAQALGHGDAALMGLFKSAFSQIVATNGASTNQTNAITLDDTSRSMLTGLADFSASIKQTAKSVNPLRPDEVDQFSYQVSQQTQITGRSPSDYTVTQQQQSHLAASYHTTLSGTDGPLDLTGGKQSQNYRYYQIEYSASSQVQIAYGKGKLIQAMLTQAASQSTRMTQYVLGKMTDDVTKPQQASTSQDFLDTLKAMNEAADDATRQRDSSRISRQVLLQPDPSQLNSSER